MHIELIQLHLIGPLEDFIKGSYCRWLCSF